MVRPKPAACQILSRFQPLSRFVVSKLPPKHLSVQFRLYLWAPKKEDTRLRVSFSLSSLDQPTRNLPPYSLANGKMNYKLLQNLFFCHPERSEGSRNN